MANRLHQISLTILVLLIAAQSSAAEIREHVVERTYTTKLTYRCIVSVPDDYEADKERQWPMILFLHGGGMPKSDQLRRSIHPLTELPAIVVAPLCPPSPDGPRYTKWEWKPLGEVVREVTKKYRVDEKMRSVIGFSMGGSGAWELPSYEPKLFTKCVVVAGVCHPWSLRHYPKTLRRSVNPGESMDPDPQSNPVNRLVKEMRDAGELVVREFDRGSPLASLPVSEAAPDDPTHLPTEEQVVAADGSLSVFCRKSPLLAAQARPQFRCSRLSRSVSHCGPTISLRNVRYAGFKLCWADGLRAGTRVGAGLRAEGGSGSVGWPRYTG